MRGKKKNSTPNKAAKGLFAKGPSAGGKALDREPLCLGAATGGGTTRGRGSDGRGVGRNASATTVSPSRTPHALSDISPFVRTRPLCTIRS